MTRYAGNAAALRALVREQEVHRDVYVSEEVFQLEMEHMFPNSWVYVGHDSQVPNPGDYFGTTIGTQPILLVRHTDGKVHVLHNRCPHKGTRITSETCGNTGKFFRCPYQPLVIARGAPKFDRLTKLLGGCPLRLREYCAVRASMKLFVGFFS